jgi:hypothetical protein
MIIKKVVHAFACIRIWILLIVLGVRNLHRLGEGGPRMKGLNYCGKREGRFALQAHRKKYLKTDYKSVFTERLRGEVRPGGQTPPRPITSLARGAPQFRETVNTNHAISGNPGLESQCDSSPPGAAPPSRLAVTIEPPSKC